MSEIHVLVGISGSGKSTLAKSLLVQYPNSIIVSRDKLREMLFGYSEMNVHEYYKNPKIKENEQKVTSVFTDIVKASLIAGKTVIADNTHLQKRFINIYKKFNKPIKYHVVDTDVETCVDRDQRRIRQVGSTVINKQHKQFKSLLKSFDFSDWEPKSHERRSDGLSCVVCDLDGTLAQMTGRGVYDDSKLLTDRVVPHIKALLEKFRSDHKIVLCTGRDEKCRDLTEQWLDQNKVEYDSLYMRPQGDMRIDCIVKHELWEEIEKDGHKIEFMIDDRDQVVNCARQLGYAVLQPDYGNF